MPYTVAPYTGAHALQAGISQGAGRLASFFQGMAADAGKAKSLRQVVKAYNPDMPTDHLGLAELEGIVQKSAIEESRRKQSLAEQVQQDQLGMQRESIALRQQESAWHRDPTNPSNQFMGAQTDQMRGSLARATSSEAGMQQFNRGLADQFQRLGEIGLQPNADDVTRLAAQNGMAGDPQVGRLSESMRRFGGENGADPTLSESFTQDPESGQRFVKFGKQILPSGSARSDTDDQLIPQRDPESGRVIGYAMRGAKGNKTFVRDPEALGPAERIAIRKAISEAKTMISPTMKPEDRAAVESDIAELQSQLTGRRTSGGRPPDGQADKAEPENIVLSPEVVRQADEIKLAVRQGKMKREAAVEALRKLGFK